MAQALMKRLESGEVQNFDLHMQAMEVLAGRKAWEKGAASSMTAQQKIAAWRTWWQEHDVVQEKLK